MSRSGSLGRARRAHRSHGRSWSHSLRWVAGAFLVCLGALAGAFGTVGWMAVLCAPSVTQVLLGVVGLGAVPVLLGSGLVWAGLHLLETDSAQARVQALTDQQIWLAAQGGTTAQALARRLGLGEAAELEARLDDMVTRDLLELEFSDEGDLIYRPRGA